MAFYIQLDQSGYIRDCIGYAHAGYVPADIPIPLPMGLIGGWYRWADGQPLFDQARYDEIHRVAELQAAVEAADQRAAGVLDEAMAIMTGEGEGGA